VRFTYTKHHLAERICNRNVFLGVAIRYPKGAPKLDIENKMTFRIHETHICLSNVVCVNWLSVAPRSPLDHHGSQPMEPSQAIGRPSVTRLGLPRLSLARPCSAQLDSASLGSAWLGSDDLQVLGSCYQATWPTRGQVLGRSWPGRARRGLISRGAGGFLGRGGGGGHCPQNLTALLEYMLHLFCTSRIDANRCESMRIDANRCESMQIDAK